MPGDGKGSSWRHCRPRGFVYFQYGNALSIVFILCLLILDCLQCSQQKYNLVGDKQLCGITLHDGEFYPGRQIIRLVKVMRCRYPQVQVYVAGVVPNLVMGQAYQCIENTSWLIHVRTRMLPNGSEGKYLTHWWQSGSKGMLGSRMLVCRDTKQISWQP